jgi:hypothetical protein
LITIGAPQAHGHSVEKPGLEGSEKEGTVAELWLASTAIRLLNPFGGSAGGRPGVSPLFLSPSSAGRRPMDALLYDNYVDGEGVVLPVLLHYSFTRIVNTIVFLKTDP